MKTFAILASAASMAAAMRSPAEPKYSLARASASSDCIPENFTVSNFEACGKNSTSLTAASFSYFDPHNGLTTTCELNSTSENLSPEGSEYPKYACDNSLVKFTWGLDEEDHYLISVSETICNGSYMTSDSWVPDFTCQNSTSGVECKLSDGLFTADFSGAPQPIVTPP